MSYKAKRVRKTKPLKGYKWKKVIRRTKAVEQNGRCIYCFTKMEKTTLEHITPTSRGGRDEESNLAAACELCNKTKGNLSKPVFLRLIKNPPAGSDMRVWECHWKRRIGLASHRACRNILRAAA